MKKNKLTYNLDKMMDGYDGITQQDYKWQIVDDPKGNDKRIPKARDRQLIKREKGDAWNPKTDGIQQIKTETK